jgi:undecaprenyl diphosphate synthase
VARPRKPLAEVFEGPPAGLDPSLLDPGRIPAHIAVIMDGNGRWAAEHGKQRAAGPKAGIRGVRQLIRTSSDLGVDFLTIYSFSTENWSRPRAEVKALMELFARTMAAELDGMHEEGVRIRLIGETSELPRRTRETFEDAVEKTRENTGMTLIIAVNYGSRSEIVEAAREIARAALRGDLGPEELEALDEQGFALHLQTTGMPDPDLLIRTSGEYRLSNFLLYQIAYSELYITPVLWPDFDRFELCRAVLAYQGRDRRFGSVSGSGNTEGPLTTAALGSDDD